MTEVFCTKCYDSVIEHASLECGHNFCFKCVSPDETDINCSKCRVNRQRYEQKFGM